MTHRTLAQIDADIDTAQAAQRAADANILTLLAERTEALNRPLALSSSPHLRGKKTLFVDPYIDQEDDLMIRVTDSTVPATPASQIIYIPRAAVADLSAHLLRLLSTCGNGNVQL